MPTHVAIQQGVLYPQPGYSLRIDREGKWTATQVFHCHRNSAAALMPRPGSHGFVDKCEDDATVRIACQASSSPQTARAFFWRTRRAAASARAFSLRRSSDSR